MTRRSRSASPSSPGSTTSPCKALDELSRPDGSNGSAVHLEDSARKQNVKASDEPELQFHQPDEAITEETIIADGRVATPEQIVGSDEMMRLIASALHDVSPAHREAFILHAIEGFGVDEISAITGASPDRVLNSISAARDHLRQSPSSSANSKGGSPIPAPHKSLSTSAERRLETERMITREQIHELAQFEDQAACALSFYFQPTAPRNKAHKEEAILTKDLAREALRQLESRTQSQRQ